MSRLTKKRSDQLIGRLHYVKKHDAIKGGIGMRSTSELAEGIGASVDVTRRLLWALADTGEIEAFSGEGSGKGPIYWQIKETVDG